MSADTQVEKNQLLHECSWARQRPEGVIVHCGRQNCKMTLNQTHSLIQCYDSGLPELRGLLEEGKERNEEYLMLKLEQNNSKNSFTTIQLFPITQKSRLKLKLQ